MYSFLFGCVLVLQGVTGNYLFPAWRPSSPNERLDDKHGEINKTATTAYYFDTFNLRKLNPAYWFYDSSQADKLDKLYELVKCVIEDETIECREKLKFSRKLFEKKSGQKEIKDKSTTLHQNIFSSTTERNVQVHSSDIQNMDQIESNRMPSTVTELERNATLRGENQ